MKINQILNVDDKVEGTAKVEYKLFSGDDNYKIAKVKILSVDLEEHEKLVGKQITVTGAIKDEDESQFRFSGIAVDKGSYGLQLALILAYPDVDVTSRKSLLEYLKRMVTQLQYQELTKTFEDPIEPLWNEDREALMQVKGIGKVRVELLIERFATLKLELKYIRQYAKYRIESNVSNKLTTAFVGRLASLVYQLENNVYALQYLANLTFEEADRIYLDNGGKVDDDFRLKGIINSEFLDQKFEGHTIVNQSDVTRKLNNYIYSEDINGLVRSIFEKFPEEYVSLGDYNFALKRIYDMEYTVAEEIHRLQRTQQNFLAHSIEKIVEEQETKNKFKFTDDQINAVQTILKSPVVTLEGPSGTGKTKSVKLLLEVLRANDYTFAQCALAGKASNVMANATGYNASTIHRLLEFNPQENGFNYNAENQLPHDVIVVDEFSMVDVELLGSLLVAIKDGAKLVLVGDMGQLEPIGIQVMRPFVESGIIPAFKYTKIHRQAEKSAIITDSIGLRKGVNPLGDECTTGKFTHGELQDLTYFVGDDDNKLIRGGLIRFKEYYKAGADVMDIQIITQTKATCHTFNKICQEYVNPEVKGEEVVEKTVGNKAYVFRKGTKVINVVNNYHTVTEDGEKLPVFNGSMGIVKRIRKISANKSEILIDFEGIGLVVMDNAKTLDYAYAVTTHKVQGSQFKHTILVLLDNQRMNTRQLLYTGMTRSQLTGDIFASYGTIQGCTLNNQMHYKRTNLCAMLKNIENFEK